MTLEMNDPYVMPDEEIKSDYKNLSPGLYVGEVTSFAVSENKPLIYMLVTPKLEVALLNPDHKKSRTKNYGKYDPPNLKKISDEIKDDQSYRIAIFLSEEPGRYPKYCRNEKNELRRLNKDGDLPEGSRFLSQREETLIDFSQMFGLGGKEMPHPDGAGFSEVFAAFLDGEVTGKKVIFQAKENGEYVNYLLRKAITEDQISQIKGR